MIGASKGEILATAKIQMTRRIVLILLCSNRRGAKVASAGVDEVQQEVQRL